MALKEPGLPGKDTSVGRTMTPFLPGGEEGEREEKALAWHVQGLRPQIGPGSERPPYSWPPTLSARRLRDGSKAHPTSPATATALNLTSSRFLPQLLPGPSSGRALRGPGSPWRPPASGLETHFQGWPLLGSPPSGGSHGLRALTCFQHTEQTPRRRGCSAGLLLALASATTKAAWREPPPDFIKLKSGGPGARRGPAHLCHRACSLAEPA